MICALCYRLVVEFHRPPTAVNPVEIKSDILRIGPQHTPSDIHFSIALVYRDHAASEFFHLPLCLHRACKK